MRRVNVSTKMLEASFEVNEYQKVYLIDRAITEAGFIRLRTFLGS